MRGEREKGEQHATKVPSHRGTTFFAGQPRVFLPEPPVLAAPLRQQSGCIRIKEGGCVFSRNAVLCLNMALVTLVADGDSHLPFKSCSMAPCRPVKILHTKLRKLFLMDVTLGKTLSCFNITTQTASYCLKYHCI